MLRPNRFHVLTIAVLVLAGAPAAKADPPWRIDGTFWSQPRDGQSVLAVDALAAAVDAWARRSGTVLVIHYPGGEQGELRAAELRDWLVALGVPSSGIERIPGGEPGGLGLDVREGRQSEQ